MARNLGWFPFAFNPLDKGYVNDAWALFVEAMGNTFNMALMGKDDIFTTGPDNYKTVFSTDFYSFELGPHDRDIIQFILGLGVFNSNGELWKFYRGMSRLFFSRDRVTDFEILA